LPSFNYIFKYILKKAFKYNVCRLVSSPQNLSFSLIVRRIAEGYPNGFGRTDVPQSLRALCLVCGTLCSLALSVRLEAARHPQSPSPGNSPDNKPVAALQSQFAQAASTTTAPKKQATGTPAPAAPPSPQSTYHPILLLVQGSDQTWSLRIGLHGPERLDRPGYPPIPLDPGDVVREGTADAWTYHAKDSQTGAPVFVHLSRTPCADPALLAAFPTAKFNFTAVMDDPQLGAHDGCARVATELFPKINNNPTDDDDDPKDKTPPPTITKFKLPVYVAYVNGQGKMLVKRGSLAKSVTGKPGSDLCLSHDGKKLLFTREESSGDVRLLDEYDFTTGQTKELLRAEVKEPFWSPDDLTIAFLEKVNAKWQLWTMPADAPEKAAALPNLGDVTTLDGWTDAHTLLGDDLQNLMWIGDDGVVKQTLPNSELYGQNQFRLSSANTVRVHPLNPDLLLVSAELAAPLPAPPPQKDATGKEITPKVAPKRDAPPAAEAFFLYEIRSKRRVLLSPFDLTSTGAEWSRDGLQIYFTGRDPASGSTTLFRIFWDGTSQTKYQDGSGFVIGQ
jgi:hypothetical protein